MKKSVRISIIAILIAASMTAFAFAASSINPGSNDPYVPGGGKVTYSKDADPSQYENEDVSALVTEVNAGSDKTIAEFLDDLPVIEGKEDPENYPTTDGYDINMELYDRITDFYEVRKITNGYDLPVGGGTVELAVPTTVGMKGTDLMILVIDSTTGELYMVPLKSFDSATGTMTFKMPCSGPYCVCHKIPIVVRNVDPDKYPSKKLARAIKKLPADEIIDCDTFIKTTKTGSASKLEVAEGVTVNPADYSAAIALSDVAVYLGQEDFSYDLSTRFMANLFRGNDKVDWERILKYAGVKYDKDAILKDDKELTKLEPIKLKNCFIYHIDAKTREVSIIYEPTLCWSTYGEMEAEKANKLTQENIQYFDVDDIDEQNVKETQLKLEEDSEEVSLGDFLGEKVYAGTKGTKAVAKDTEDVCIVFNGDQYLGMGPFLFFMPKSSELGFPWWILLLIMALIIIAYIIYRNNKKKKEKNAVR